MCTGSVWIDYTKGRSSNYGSVIDVFAPGIGIKSAWNDSDTETKVIGGTSSE
jgi:hypothetical protein